MDIENWERKEHYYHYSNITQCTYGITIKLEVSNIIRDSLKF
ncbi:CatA-like O-acetyltransferase, partial [Helicobacter rodentium]